MPGCVVRCSNVLPGENGQELTRALEYESIVLLGSNCGISDLDAIAILNHRCDELGLDTMEMGVAIGVAMEAGLASFGDAEAALKLVNEVAAGSALGRVLGSGAAVTGKVFGVARVPVVLGQAISAYDPRSLKGTGVTYATSPMGADHTAGNALPGSMLPDGTKPDPTQSENQVRLSRYLQHLAMTFDSLGLCWFTRGPILTDPSLLMDILHAAYGGTWNMEKLLEQAGEALQVELAFNRAAGLGDQHDLPYFFRTEPIGMQGRVFDVPVQDLNQTLLRS
jgi:aldehyde:ferredoxin oxidoreductase